MKTSKLVFEYILENLEMRLNRIRKENPSSIMCERGEDFEKVVYDLVQSISSEISDHSIRVYYSRGSHNFPDIVLSIDGDKSYGIEVKMSKSKSKSWKTNGNSIMGSTHDKEVNEIYIVFGKMYSMKMMQFKIAKYEDSVSNIVVTHSPRYLIDMETSEESNFFNKSGITFENLLTNEDSISVVTDYFTSIGEKAWWLSQSTPATIRLITELNDKEKDQIISEAFAYFPEILSSKQKKYKNLAIWLITEKSVISPYLRDLFSAGGRINLTVDGVLYKNISKVYGILYNHITTISTILNDTGYKELNDYWGTNILTSDNLSSKKTAWKELVKKQLNDNSQLIIKFIENII